MNKTIKTISIVLLVLGTISLIAGLVWQGAGTRTMQPLFSPPEGGEFRPTEGNDITGRMDDSARPGGFGRGSWLPFNLPILLAGAGGVLLISSSVLQLIEQGAKESVKRAPAINHKPKRLKQAK
jgi:hypothetical protein